MGRQIMVTRTKHVRHPRNRRRRIVRGVAGAFFTLLQSLEAAVALPPAPNQLPQSPNVTAGQVSVTTSGSSMTVNQGTTQAIVNWNSFDIGSQASVTIVQPSSSSAILNRVLSTDPTQIFGHLSANGQIVLINPQGVVFGGGSVVDVGSLIASTMNIADSDFLSGNYNFVRNGATGSVVN